MGNVSKLLFEYNFVLCHIYWGCDFQFNYTDRFIFTAPFAPNQTICQYKTKDKTGTTTVDVKKYK